MFGNLDIELQTAQHIAKNGTDRRQWATIHFMLGWALSTVLLYLFTPLNLQISALVGFFGTAIVAIPLNILSKRRQAKEANELAKIQTDQLRKHRAEMAKKADARLVKE